MYRPSSGASASATIRRSSSEASRAQVSRRCATASSSLNQVSCSAPAVTARYARGIPTAANNSGRRASAGISSARRQCMRWTASSICWCLRQARLPAGAVVRARPAAPAGGAPPTAPAASGPMGWVLCPRCREIAVQHCPKLLLSPLVFSAFTSPDYRLSVG